MRSFKSFHRLKLLKKSISKLVHILGQEETKLNLESVNDMQIMINETSSTVETIGFDLLALMKMTYHLQFATVIYSAISRIHFIMRKMYGILDVIKNGSNFNELIFKSSRVPQKAREVLPPSAKQVSQIKVIHESLVNERAENEQKIQELISTSREVIQIENTNNHDDTNLNVTDVIVKITIEVNEDVQLPPSTNVVLEKKSFAYSDIAKELAESRIVEESIISDKQKELETTETYNVDMIEEETINNELNDNNNVPLQLRSKKIVRVKTNKSILFSGSGFRKLQRVKTLLKVRKLKHFIRMGS